MENKGPCVSRWLACFFFIIFTVLAPTTMSYPIGITGEAVEHGCLCHGGGIASDSVSIEVTGFPEKWEASVKYEISITTLSSVSEDGSALGGFNLHVDAGSLSVLDDAVHVVDGEATHTESGNMDRTWTVIWTAPSSYARDISYRVYANTVDGDGTADSDDAWSVLTGLMKGPPSDDSPGAGEPSLMPPFLLGLAASLIIVHIIPHGGARTEVSDEDE